ncbi:iron-containing alcohol dehydrogenase [Pectinatus brassicae]|uniref:Alcohol dehydrogenase class IV n=1 Tax=Pectinatus brassicae TaxID=862415 RepID=A0A840UIC1_9FIRM|nr:iron-containing alcohol dehydrogenase [Pectinatus brassicae]MBB5336856.1 alcohol dehydrogenase class IV [Pectinatus brassicae]
MCEEVERFRRGIGVGNTLRDLGVKYDDLPQLVDYALRDACMSTNPKPMTVKDVTAVYEQAF